MQTKALGTQIDVRPVAGALGAELIGVDLKQPLDEATMAAVMDAWTRYSVVFFRDQNLSVPQLEAFGRRIGDLSRVFYVNPVEGSEHVTRLLRLADAGKGTKSYGEYWHMDQTTHREPPKAFLLQNVESPPYGGDTQFSSLYAAYEALSDGMQALCDRLIVVHSPTGFFGKGKTQKPLETEGSASQFNTDLKGLTDYIEAEVEHPLVCVHPLSGRKHLYMSRNYTVRFKDMTEQESKPILDYLQNHIERPEFTCRFRWSVGAVALIDNRCLQHFAINDYTGHRRDMLRLQIAGEPPVGPAMPNRLAAAA